MMISIIQNFGRKGTKILGLLSLLLYDFFDFGGTLIVLLIDALLKTGLQTLEGQLVERHRVEACDGEAILVGEITGAVQDVGVNIDGAVDPDGQCDGIASA